MRTMVEDWADRMAQDILSEIRKFNDQPGLPLILASRLRVLKHEGHQEGLVAARKAVVKKPTSEKVS